MFKDRKLKKISICLAIIVVSSMVIWNNSCLTVNANIIPFKDSNLKKYFCGEDGSGLNQSNFDNQLNAHLKDEHIWSLEGIQNLRNLESISLDNTNVWDLSPLSNLSKVKEVSIFGGCVTDLTPLGNLKNLKSIECRDLKLDEYSAIGNLENIVRLRLENCNIKDLSFLKKLKNLKRLDLRNNYIENIEALRELKKLREIILIDNEIKDITPLLDLPSKDEYVWEDNNDDHKRTINLEGNCMEIVNDRKSRKVIKELKRKRFEVLCDSSALSRVIYPIKINGEKWCRDHRVKTDRDVCIEFNCDIESKLQGTTLGLYDGVEDYYVDYKLQGNCLIFNPSKAFEYSDSVLIRFRNCNYPILCPKLYEDYDLHGDVNKDGKTDITDLSIAAKDYNKNSRDATTWNINEDCNKDGRIDIYDISIICSEIE